MEDMLQVGVITATHGIRGEVKVFPTTDDPARFKEAQRLVLDTGKEKLPLKVSNVRFFKQFVILKFEGIDHINEIEKYKKCSLLVSREDAVPLGEDEYFVADMIGLSVVTEDEEPFGILKDVIMTLFPDMVMEGLNTSITGRAVSKGLLSVEAVNIRDYAFNKHNSVDDYPYGGGAGMLMQAEPVYQCYKSLKERIRLKRLKKEQDGAGKSDNQKKTRVVYLSPQGQTFHQSMAEEFAKEEELILLCGHYEGIDERVLEEIVTDYVSIGDYVLTGGELPAMVMVDAIARLVPGVLHNDVSAEFESFQDNLLEYPQYSRPEVWHEKRVPEVLLSGHHANIEKWRREQSVIRTAKKRPDLLEKALLTEAEILLAESVKEENI